MTKGRALMTGSESFAEGVLNALSSHIAVLDRCSRIISVNDAWRQLARENRAPPAGVKGTGVDYLSVCQAAAGLETAGKERREVRVRVKSSLSDIEVIVEDNRHWARTRGPEAGL